MRVGLLLLLALIGILSITSTLAHIEPDDSEADDFAEFDFDEDNENENGAASNAQTHPKAAVEEDDFDDEDDEFENDRLHRKKPMLSKILMMMWKMQSLRTLTASSIIC